MIDYFTFVVFFFCNRNTPFPDTFLALHAIIPAELNISHIAGFLQTSHVYMR